MRGRSAPGGRYGKYLSYKTEYGITPPCVNPRRSSSTCAGNARHFPGRGKYRSCVAVYGKDRHNKQAVLRIGRGPQEGETAHVQEGTACCCCRREGPGTQGDFRLADAPGRWTPGLGTGAAFRIRCAWEPRLQRERRGDGRRRGLAVFRPAGHREAAALDRQRVAAAAPSSAGRTTKWTEGSGPVTHWRGPLSRRRFTRNGSPHTSLVGAQVCAI